MVSPTRYIYDPDDVQQALAGLPNVAAHVAQIGRKDAQSAGFPTARTSPREIFRFLTRRHAYPHLGLLLQAADACMVDGWVPASMLKASDPAAWDAGISEVCIANHLRRRGYALQPPPAVGSGRRPEFVAERGGDRVAVEVYCPRVCDGLDRVFDDLRLAIEHLDAPWDFCYSIDCPATPAERLGFDAWSFSEAAGDVLVRRAVVAGIVRDLANGLRRGGAVQVGRNILAVHVVVTVDDVVAANHGLPSRLGSIASRDLEGHAPERIFDRLVGQNVRHKMDRRQAVVAGVAAVPMLVVDLRKSQCWSEWGHDAYRRTFGNSIERLVCSNMRGHGIVAFGIASCDPVPQLYGSMVAADPTVRSGLTADLFGRGGPA